MKFTFFLPAFLLGAVFVSVQVFSAQIMPMLYATKFCELRSIGVSKDDAIRGAIDYSYNKDLPSVKIKWQGQLVEADVLNAALETRKLCPHYMD